MSDDCGHEKELKELYDGTDELEQRVTDLERQLSEVTDERDDLRKKADGLQAKVDDARHNMQVALDDLKD